jgi:hypothetical protein
VRRERDRSRSTSPNPQAAAAAAAPLSPDQVPCIVYTQPKPERMSLVLMSILTPTPTLTHTYTHIPSRRRARIGSCLPSRLPVGRCSAGSCACATVSTDFRRFTSCGWTPRRQKGDQKKASWVLRWTSSWLPRRRLPRRRPTSS